jgi:hypothetical protein
MERRNMSRESTEELRQRLLRDERVRELISRRAYEIYVMRGGHPGGEGHDWFQAESDILSILIEEESRRASESTGTSDSDETSEPVDETSVASPVAESLGVPETSDRMQQPSGLTAKERAESQSTLNTWSTTEPPSAERAPVIGDAGEFQTGMSPSKKARSRAAAKPTAPRKSKPSTGKSTAAKEPAAKESAAKEPAAKKIAAGKATARPAASNESAEPQAKTTRSRKKSKE